MRCRATAASATLAPLLRLALLLVLSRERNCQQPRWDDDGQRRTCPYGKYWFHDKNL